jgi:hypothetical protein
LPVPRKGKNANESLPVYKNSRCPFGDRLRDYLGNTLHHPEKEIYSKRRKYGMMTIYDIVEVTRMKKLSVFPIFAPISKVCR